MFATALNLPYDPAELLAKIFDGLKEQLGGRIVRAFLEVWRQAEARRAALALVRSATTNEHAATVLRQLLGSVVLTRVAGAFDIPLLRLEAAAGQIIGVALLRYVFRVEPLASADDEEAVAAVAPAVQLHIDAPSPPRQIYHAWHSLIGLALRSR